MSTAFERRVKKLRDHVSQNSDVPIGYTVKEEDTINAIDYEGLTKSEVIDLLHWRGIEHNPKGKKEDLINLLTEGE